MRKGLGPAGALAVVLAVLLGAGPVCAGGIEFGPPTARQQKVVPKKKTPPPPRAAEPLPEDLPSSALPVAVKPPVAATKTGAVKARVPFDEATFKPAPRTCKNTENFKAWLAELRREAQAEGISNRAIGAVLNGMTLDRGVIKRDRRQGFFAISFLAFSKKLATQHRVKSGRAQIRKNKAAFARATKEFGVPPSVITGFWALESDFGKGMGNLPILRSIVTLAYDCRRGPMFREEVKAAMRIIERGDMAKSEMIGSWAGEIGQTQFLPTRYLEYAIDYDGDGRADLFRNNTDIIGSTANYMKHLGWRANEPWLEEVLLSKALPWDQADLAIKHPRSQWAKWGVKMRNGGALSADAHPASLLLPMGRHGPAFLAYSNFDIYLKWNQSLNYATTAAWLATRIDGAPLLKKSSRQIAVLGPKEARELQRQLVRRGYDVGEIDGLIGAKTRKAVKAMQLKYKMPADSYPTPELLAALRRGR